VPPLPTPRCPLCQDAGWTRIPAEGSISPALVRCSCHRPVAEVTPIKGRKTSKPTQLRIVEF
jgi:hypothetical protein